MNNLKEFINKKCSNCINNKKMDCGEIVRKIDGKYDCVNYKNCMEHKCKNCNKYNNCFDSETKH